MEDELDAGPIEDTPDSPPPETVDTFDELIGGGLQLAVSTVFGFSCTHLTVNWLSARERIQFNPTCGGA